MEERNRWEPMPGMEVGSMFAHPNGKLFIATMTNNNGTVQLWDMQTKGKPIFELPGHKFQGDKYSRGNRHPMRGL
jgi:WD40 repeat protein